MAGKFCRRSVAISLKIEHFAVLANFSIPSNFTILMLFQEPDIKLSSVLATKDAFSDT